MISRIGLVWCYHWVIGYCTATGIKCKTLVYFHIFFEYVYYVCVFCSVLSLYDENSFTREWDELQLIIYFIESGLVPRLGKFKVTAALFLYASVDVDVRPFNQ